MLLAVAAFVALASADTALFIAGPPAIAGLLFLVASQGRVERPASQGLGRAG